MLQYSWRVWLAGGVFLLLPLAHLRPIDTLPLYAAEFPLLCLLLLQGLEYIRSGNAWPEAAFDRSILVGAGLFISGVFLTFWMNQLAFPTLGLVKSFVVLPVFFMIWLGMSHLQPREHVLLLGLWALGTASAGVAALMTLSLAGVTYDARLASLYSSPNYLAMLLGPGVLIGAFFWFFGKERIASRWIRFGILAAGLLMLLSLGLTRSYGGVTATGAALIFWLILCVQWGGIRTRSLWWMLGLSGMLFFAWVAHEYSTDKFQALILSDSRSSLASRCMIWKASIRIAQESFPWGIGIGQFQAAYLAYQPFFPPYLEWAVPEPHNLFLALFFAGGLLSLIAFMGLLVMLVRRLFLLIRKMQSSVVSLGALYLSLIFYWILFGLVDTPYFKNDLALSIWSVLGLAWSLIQSKAFLSKPRD